MSLNAIQECAGFRGPFEVLSVNSREVRSSLKNSNLNQKSHRVYVRFEPEVQWANRRARL